MGVVRNNHVLTVTDADATAAFFIDTLGFVSLDVPDPKRRFVERDNFVITIRSNPDAIPVADLGDHAQIAYWVVDDARAYFDRVRKNGAEVTRELADQPWGMREFELRTPDGHRIKIGQAI